MKIESVRGALLAAVLAALPLAGAHAQTTTDAPAQPAVPPPSSPNSPANNFDFTNCLAKGNDSAHCRLGNGTGGVPDAAPKTNDPAVTGTTAPTGGLAGPGTTTGETTPQQPRAIAPGNP
ncbi:hypothetical protein SAMN05216548_10479 [Faunimonas pinastri]|uniref:Uncharacterized protein n=1 Tax=Faunimonas pinastri TaxID=1855383 RepID=A0A1H9FCW4_9HYPH|nr:hypothetical protein [Faunimonas pinastri]SEQ35781.1 hypothetical protein SAMN05216548_10479 [Faunimonas pinastri]